MSCLPNDTHNNAGLPIPQKTKNELFLEQLQNKDGGDQFLTIPADVFLTKEDVDQILKMISVQHKYNLNLEIDLTVMPIEHLTQLIYLANHLRYRSVHGEMRLTLSITDRSAYQNNFEKISYFLQSLTNEAFTSLNLCSPFLNPEDIEPKIYADQLLEFFHKMASYLKKFKYDLSLQNFHLNIIGVKAILSIMQKIDVFRFSLHVGNDLYKLDLKDLTELFSAIKPTGQSEQPSKSYYFWDYHDFDKSFLAFSKSWNQQQRLQFIQLDIQHFQMARIYYYQELNLALAPSTPEETESAIKAFLSQFVQLGESSYYNHHYSEQVGLCIQKGTLSYERRKSLAQECLALKCFPGLAMFELSAKDQLPLFLSWLAANEDASFYDILKGANLYNTDLPISILLRAWEPYTNLEYFDKDNVEKIYAILVSDVLPKLKQACETIWKEKHNRFYDFFFQKVSHFKIQEDYDIQKLLNMTQWFTYLATTIYHYEIKNLDLHTPLLKEVMNYADPTMRYTLIKLWAEVLRHPQGADLFSFLKQSQTKQKNTKTTSFLIPSIFICTILLQSQKTIIDDTKGDTKELEKEPLTNDQITHLPSGLKTIPYLSAAQEILNSLHHQYSEGHSLRTFVGGLAILTNSQELHVSLKIKLMQNIFDLNKKRKQFENTINTSLKGDMTIATLTQKLKALLSPEFYNSFNIKHYIPVAEETNTIPAKSILTLRRRLTEDYFYKTVMKQELKNQLSRWVLVQGMGLLKQLPFIASLPPSEYNQMIQTLFRKNFNLSEAQVESYNHIVAGLRNEGALLTYLGKLRSLKDEEARALETLYHRFVHAILTKDSAEFYQIRYQNLKHLEAVFRRRPLLREQWPHRLEFDLDTFIASYQLKPKLPYGDLEKFIYSKIFLHHHIHDSKSFIQLKTYLESTDPDIRKNILGQLEKEAEVQKSIVEATPPAKEAADQKSIAEVNPFATESTVAKPILVTFFQKTLIELIETNPTSYDKQAALTQSALTLLKALCETCQVHGNEFMNDLRALQKSLSSLKFKFMPTNLKDWKISFTDHFWTLLLIGTDVPGSCQRVDGDPQLNKCLLAYLMDGKNKAIVIQDETGKTHARAIIRLLLDAKTNEPVLFFEQIYPDFVAPLFREALLQCATLVANALDLSLLAKEGYDNAQDYPEPVMSLGSVGPEYVDALHDERDEPYEIPQSKVLFSAYPQGRAIVTQFLSSQKVINTVFDYLYSDDHREGSILNFKAFGK